LQGVKIKYLSLKAKFLETEQKLLMNGIDISEFSIFGNENEDTDSDIDVVNDIVMIDNSSATENENSYK